MRCNMFFDRCKRGKPTAGRSPQRGGGRTWASDQPLWLLKLRLGSRTRLGLYQKLGRFVANGVPVTQALEQMQRHASEDGRRPGSVEAQVVHLWRQSMLNGQSLARALRGWATPAELSVLDAGEVAGRLDQAIEDVVFIHHATQAIRSALTGLI